MAFIPNNAPWKPMWMMTSSMIVDRTVTANLQSFQPEDSIAFIVNAMHVDGYRHVPIVDMRNIPVAVISATDIISFIAENFPDEVIKLSPYLIQSTQERKVA